MATFSHHEIRISLDTVRDGRDTLKCRYLMDYIHSGKKNELGTAMNLFVQNAVLGHNSIFVLPEKQFEDSIKSDFNAFHGEWQRLRWNSPEISLNYVKEVKAAEAYETKNFITLYAKTHYYTTGDHGLDWMEYAVFSKRTCKKVAHWYDLFSDTAAVMKYAHEKMKKEKFIMFGYSLPDGGWFQGKGFYLTDNFAVNPNGILFYYNVWEIAGYDEGITQLILPYGEIKQWLKNKIP